MRVSVFGATGGVGLCLVRKLLASEDTVEEVQCLVRNSSKLPQDLREHSRLRVIEGSATKEGDVEAATTGTDVVIVSLGGPPKGPGVDICSKAQELINSSVNRGSPEAHVIVISSIGVGDHFQHCGLFAKFFASYIIPEALADKDKQERMCREQVKNWTIVRPGGLVDKPESGVWDARPEACGAYPTIPREDVAGFILKECLAPSNQWLRRSVALVSPSFWRSFAQRNKSASG